MTDGAAPDQASLDGAAPDQASLDGPTSDEAPPDRVPPDQAVPDQAVQDRASVDRSGPDHDDERPRRILILGGQGTGKTTLARAIAAATGWPLHELDLVARHGGGTGPERSAEARAVDVAAIAASDAWVAEGVHLDWTEPLLTRAERIVWLDHVRGRAASARMVRRFGANAWHEMRTRRGRERFLRVRDYLGHGRDLLVSVASTRQAGSASDPFEVALAPHARRVIRCRTQADVDEAMARLVGSGGTRATTSGPVGRS
ncbi:MAG: AAA family ATPase [Chloroflexi bacterium]|nr:AAA family ATPase [Chloroflexota bacterium]